MTDRYTLPTLCFSLLTFSGALAASPMLEEVMVTGELHDTQQLALSNSVSVMDAQLIEQRNAHNLEDLLNLAPNVNFSAGASRGRFIQIRGIGERSEFVAPINPSVGVIVDGIDFTGLATGVTALDAAQVEVFRGPQGTLYGANALAGMINVVGNAPTDSASGKLRAGAGNYGSYNLEGMLNHPLGDAVGWRLAAQKNVSDGYMKDAYLDRKDTNNIDEASLRNQFRWQVSDDLQADLISYWIDIDNGYDAFSLDNNRTTLSDQPGHDRQQSTAHALKTHYSGAAFADVQALLSVADSNIEYGYDEDWSFRDICAENSDCAYYQYSTFDNYERDNRNVSADVRLMSKAESAGDWALGVYYRDQQVDLLRTYTNNVPNGDFYGPLGAPEISVYTSDYSTQNAAVYGQAGIDLKDNLKVVTGLRYESFTAEFSDSQGAKFEPDESHWGGKLALEYTTAAGNMIYGLISRGYKVGGFNPDPSLEEDVKAFSSETMLNYEVGVKGLWLENRLSAQVAAFYQQRDDIQVKQSRAYPLDVGFEFVDFFDNATSGSNAGVETEIRFSATDALSLFGSLALLQTEFNDFVNLSHVDRNEETGEGYDMSGRDQAHAPGYQYFVGGQYRVLDNLYARIEFEGKDSFYFSESHNEQSEPYQLINARLDYEIGNTSLAVWGKNLTDETVETRGFYFSNSFGNDPRKMYAPEPYTQKGAPLTFGVSVTQRF